MYKKLLFAVSLLFGISSANAQISAETANQQLSSQAKMKIVNGNISLKSLLENDSNDLIIEFNIPESYLSSGKDIRDYLLNQKQLVKTQFNKRAGLELLREYNALPMSFYRITNRDVLVQLLNNPNIKAVYPNLVSKKTLGKSLDFIGQPIAKSKGFTGQGTSIVVLDSGVDYRHTDLGSCTSPGKPSSCHVSYALEMVPEDNVLDDSDRHGTNVASIAANVAPDAKIIGMDVFRGKKYFDSDLVSALNWVTNNAKTLNIKVVNMSLGGDTHSSICTSSLTQSFQNIRKVGVIPVVAAGNDAFINRISHPACIQGAVSVGAVYDENIGAVQYKSCTDKNSYSDKVACFSNSSSILTILAPGTNVTAGGSVPMYGTSQATPHVAGAIAVLRASNAMPNETLDATINRLKNTGVLVTDQRSSMKFPRLDLAAAVNSFTISQNQVLPSNPTPTTPTISTPVTSAKNCRTYYWFTICES